MEERRTGHLLEGFWLHQVAQRARIAEKQETCTPSMSRVAYFWWRHTIADQTPTRFLSNIISLDHSWILMEHVFQHLNSSSLSNRNFQVFEPSLPVRFRAGTWCTTPRSRDANHFEPNRHCPCLSTFRVKGQPFIFIICYNYVYDFVRVIMCFVLFCIVLFKYCWCCFLCVCIYVYYFLLNHNDIFAIIYILIVYISFEYALLYMYTPWGWVQRNVRTPGVGKWKLHMIQLWNPRFHMFFTGALNRDFSPGKTGFH